MAGKGIQIIVGADYNGKDLNRAAADIQKMQREARTTAVRMQEMGANLSKVGRSLTTFVTLPLVAAGAAAVAMAVEFEDSMSKITGLVGIAADEVAAMKDEVLAISGETARAPQELADALFVLTSAGLRGDDAMAALEASGKAAAAGLGETKDIARALAGAMNAYGSDVLDAAAATDVIVATARAGNFETSQFASSLGRILPFANQAQVSFADMGGAVALLTRTNGDAAQSVTQLSALFRAFVIPTTEGQKILSELGMTAEDVRTSLGEQGLASTLSMLDDKLGGNREKLGKLIGSSEGAAAAFQILDADAATLQATFGEVNSAAGITDEAFGVVSETTGFKLKRAMETLKGVLIQIGDVLAPLVEKFADFATRALEGFQQLPDGTKQIVVALAGVAAAIGPILMVVGKLLPLLGGLSSSLGVGGVAGALSALTGPVGIVIAAIAALIGIVVMMWKESETFRNAVSDAFNMVKDAVSSAVGTIQGALEDNADAINTVREVFKALGDFVGTFIIPLYANYLSKAIEVIVWLIARWIDYIGLLIGAYRAALPYLLDFAAEVVSGFGKMVDFILLGVEQLLDGLATALGWVPGIGDAINQARDAVHDFRNNVKTDMAGVEAALRGASDSVQEWGDDSAQNLDDYRDAAVRAKTATGDLAIAADGAVTSTENMTERQRLLADVTNQTAYATQSLNDAYALLKGVLSESAAIDRAYESLQAFHEQVGTNTAGFDGMSDAARANRAAFRDWANDQIAAAESLTDPIARLDALKAIQQEARDALREQGIKPSESGFYQEIKGTVDEAKAAVEGMDDAVTAAEDAGLDVASAIAKGIEQGMSEQAAAINAAGLAGGEELADGVNTSLGINSPSKVAMEAGANVATGLANGLANMSTFVNLGGISAGVNLISGLIAGLDSMSGSLYARVRAIVAAAIAAANAAASGGTSGGSGTDTTKSARGGLITGRGGPMSDMIPAMLSSGEFVVRAQSVDKFGAQFFDQLNRGHNPLDGMDAPTPGVTVSGGLTINGGITVQSAPNERAEESLPRALRRMSFLAGV